MSIQLSPEQQDALLAQPGMPVRVEDEQSQTAFYLVNESSLLHMQALGAERSVA